MKKLLLHLFIVAIGAGIMTPMHASFSQQEKILMGIGAGLIALPTIIMPLYDWAKDTMTSDEDALYQMCSQYETIEFTYHTECGFMQKMETSCEFALGYMEAEVASIILSKNQTYKTYYEGLKNALHNMRSIKERMEKRHNAIKTTSLRCLYEKLGKNLNNLFHTLNQLEALVYFIVETEKDEALYRELLPLVKNLQKQYFYEENVLGEMNFLSKNSEAEIIVIGQKKGHCRKYPLMYYKQVISQDIYRVKEWIERLNTRGVNYRSQKYYYIHDPIHLVVQNFENLLKDLGTSLYILQKTYDIVIHSSAYLSECSFKRMEDDMERRERELKREVEQLKYQVNKRNKECSSVIFCLKSDTRVEYPESFNTEIINPFND